MASWWTAADLLDSLDPEENSIVSRVIQAVGLFGDWSVEELTEPLLSKEKEDGFDNTEGTASGKEKSVEDEETPRDKVTMEEDKEEQVGKQGGDWQEEKEEGKEQEDEDLQQGEKEEVEKGGNDDGNVEKENKKQGEAREEEEEKTQKVVVEGEVTNKLGCKVEIEVEVEKETDRQGKEEENTEEKNKVTPEVKEEEELIIEGSDGAEKEKEEEEKEQDRKTEEEEVEEKEKVGEYERAVQEAKDGEKESRDERAEKDNEKDVEENKEMVREEEREDDRAERDNEEEEKEDQDQQQIDAEEEELEGTGENVAKKEDEEQQQIGAEEEEMEGRGEKEVEKDIQEQQIGAEEEEMEGRGEKEVEKDIQEQQIGAEEEEMEGRGEKGIEKNDEEQQIDGEEEKMEGKERVEHHKDHKQQAALKGEETEGLADREKSAEEQPNDEQANQLDQSDSQNSSPPSPLGDCELAETLSHDGAETGSEAPRVLTAEEKGSGAARNHNGDIYSTSTSNDNEMEGASTASLTDTHLPSVDVRLNLKDPTEEVETQSLEQHEGFETSLPTSLPGHHGETAEEAADDDIQDITPELQTDLQASCCRLEGKVAVMDAAAQSLLRAEPGSKELSPTQNSSSTGNPVMEGKEDTGHKEEGGENSHKINGKADAANDKKSVSGQSSKYKTVSYRKIQKGNTRQRIDEFESMMVIKP